MEELYAGYASEEITPPIGIIGRVGLDHTLSWPGHPTQVRALYFRSNTTEVVQLTGEIVGFVGELESEVRERIVKATGIPSGHITITATHTHASPWIWLQQARDAALVGVELLDHGWIARLKQACVDAALRARGSARPAVLKVGRAQVVDVASNRVEHGWRGSITTDAPLRAQPVGHIDPELRLLAVCEADGSPRAMAVNYSCHPSGYGGGRVRFASPDFPHFAERQLVHFFGRPVPMVYWVGCAGDINPGKFCAEGSDLEIAGFGRRLADAVMKAWEGSVRLEGQVSISHVDMRVQAGEWLGTEEEARERFLSVSPEVSSAVAAGRPVPEDQVRAWRRALKRLDSCRIEAGRGMPIRLSRLDLGELSIIFVPGEWFVRLWPEVTRRRGVLDGGVPAAWVTTLANFDLLYVPDPTSRTHTEWYGVDTHMRTLSDAGIDEMVAAAARLAGEKPHFAAED